jgi:hypothetical protein
VVWVGSYYQEDTLFWPALGFKPGSAFLFAAVHCVYPRPNLSFLCLLIFSPQDASREALMSALAARSGHTSIVPFYGVASQNEKLILLFAFCPNGDLKSWLRSRPSASERQRVVGSIRFCAFQAPYSSKARTPRNQIFELASGIAHLHSQHIIHNDLHHVRQFSLSRHRPCADI